MSVDEFLSNGSNPIVIWVTVVVVGAFVIFIALPWFWHRQSKRTVSLARPTTDQFAANEIQHLVNRAAKTAQDHGWWEEPRSFGDLIALTHTELSEAFEEFRNGHEPNEIYVVDGKPEGVPIELADAQIRIFDMAARYDIDLGSAIIQKMAYNETREYKHGGKKL